MAEQLALATIESSLCAEIRTLLGKDASAVAPDVELRSLGLDSLRLVSLLIAIEKAFGINLMKAGLRREALKSVRTLAAAIHAALIPK